MTLWVVALLALVFGMLWFGNSMGWGPNDKRWAVLLWVLGLGFWGGILVWAGLDGGIEAALQALGMIGLIFGLALLFALTEQYGIREGLTRLAVLAGVGLVVAAICEVDPVVGIGWVMIGFTAVWFVALRGRPAGRSSQ